MHKNFVLPKVYFIGSTNIDLNSLKEYLKDTDQEEFLDDINESQQQGLNNGEILCSFYAKACYASLTTKKNKNISRTRDIKSNIAGILSSGHGSVLEHCFLNFMVTDCSRIYTHELVRHRAGTSFSQTSGRFVRSDVLNIILDPILGPIKEHCEKARKFIEEWYKEAQDLIKIDEIKDFTTKKKITSALRRFLPNGQSNEIGFGVNLRSLRHTIEMRTSEHAEWEIRHIFNQVYHLVKDKYPAIFIDSHAEEKDGLLEVTFENKKV